MLLNQRVCQEQQDYDCSSFPGKCNRHTMLTESQQQTIAIILAFTAGTLINRRRLKPHLHHHQRDIESIPECIAGEKRTAVSSAERRKKREKSASDMLVFRWLSWIFGTFPFLPEIWYWLLTYWFAAFSHLVTRRTTRNKLKLIFISKGYINLVGLLQPVPSTPIRTSTPSPKNMHCNCSPSNASSTSTLSRPFR